MKILGDISDFLLGVIKIGGPIFVVILATLIVGSMLKWAGRIQESILAIFKNPLRVIIWIVIIVFGLILFFRYAYPVLGVIII